MNYTFHIDWKFVVALGTAVSGVILSLKMTPDAAEKVSTIAVDAYREYLNAEYGSL